MYKVSVIIPIYNAGEYLKNTLNSVINQTIGFENIELILVDDCSTDNSRDIIEEYSNGFPNIKKIFLEKNSGCPGIPCNIGIKNATSDYIMFIDNDDDYLPEICDKLYNTIISEDADIVVCKAVFIDSNGNMCEYTNNSGRVLLNEDIIYFTNVFVWNCIFKKSIISDNNLEFVDGVYEDGIFTLEYRSHSKKLIYLSDFIGYSHIPRKDSMSNFALDYYIRVINAFYILARILEKNNGDLNRFFEYHIRAHMGITVLEGNKEEINVFFSELSDFEREINFKSTLPIGFNLINYFILRGNLNMATYIALFFQKLLKSSLIKNICRNFFKKYN